MKAESPLLDVSRAGFAICPPFCTPPASVFLLLRFTHFSFSRWHRGPGSGSLWPADHVPRGPCVPRMGCARLLWGSGWITPPPPPWTRRLRTVLTGRYPGSGPSSSGREVCRYFECHRDRSLISCSNNNGCV